jgi:putative transposase
MKLCGTSTIQTLQAQHRNWVNEALLCDPIREDKWTESIAVGSESFVDRVKTSLGVKSIHKEIIEREDSYFIKEGIIPYNAHYHGKMDTLRGKSTIKCDT